MIAPIIAALLRRKTCTKSSWVTEEEPYKHTTQDSKNNLQLTVDCLAPYAADTVTVVKNSEIPITVKTITLSCSGIGKYRLIKNDVVIATLFCRMNLFYPHNISIKVGDTLMVECLNADNQAQTMYVGFDVEEV